MCRRLVKDGWENSSSIGVQEKVKQCGEKLEAWGKELTNNFSSIIKACKTELKQLRNRRDNVSTEKYKEVKKQLFLILDQKEIFWRQCSKQL